MQGLLFLAEQGVIDLGLEPGKVESLLEAEAMELPQWLATTVEAWTDGSTSDEEFVSAMGHFIDSEVIAPRGEGSELDSASMGGQGMLALNGGRQTIQVPLDYSNPDGEQIAVDVTVIPAIGEEPIGVLFYVAGGTDSKGVHAVERVVSYFLTEELRKKFHLVSYNTRGNGDVFSVGCEKGRGFTLWHDTHGASLDEQSNIDGLLETYQDWYQSCAVDDDSRYWRFMGSNNAARDIDTIRVALGVEQLSILASSFGTRIASVYADMYPERVRAMVLDGAMDPNSDMIRGGITQAQTDQRLLDVILSQCVQDGQCPEDIHQRVFAQYQALPSGPSPQDGSYTQDHFVQYLRKLVQTYSVGDFSIGPELELLVGVLYNNASADTLDPKKTLLGIGDMDQRYCIDTDVRYSRDQIAQLVQEYDQASPIFGPREMVWRLMCSSWPKNQDWADPIPVVSAARAPPILVIGGTFDVPTPLAWAEEMVSSLGSGVLVTSEHDGHLGVFWGDSDCLDTLATDYFLDPTATITKTHCPREGRAKTLGYDDSHTQGSLLVPAVSAETFSGGTWRTCPASELGYEGKMWVGEVDGERETVVYVYDVPEIVDKELLEQTYESLLGATSGTLTVLDATSADALPYGTRGCVNVDWSDEGGERADICANVEGIPPRECEALVSFYEFTGGDKWKDSSGWLQTSTPCSWRGVKCEAGSVVELSMDENRVRGTLPRALVQLTELRELGLTYGGLEGTIPAWLGELEKLEVLHFEANGFSGRIPPELGHLSQLRWLNLSGNDLTGPIPGTLGDLGNLERLDLSFNQLRTLPAELGKLVNLVQLNLYYNELDGEIPASFGELAKLETLRLGANGLDGDIPRSLANISGLVELDLQFNVNLGPLPEELLHLHPGTGRIRESEAGTVPSQLRQPAIGEIAWAKEVVIDRESEVPTVEIFVDTRGKTLEIEVGFYDESTKRVHGVVHEELVSRRTTLSVSPAEWKGIPSGTYTVWVNLVDSGVGCMIGCAGKHYARDEISWVYNANPELGGPEVQKIEEEDSSHYTWNVMVGDHVYLNTRTNDRLHIVDNLVTGERTAIYVAEGGVSIVFAAGYNTDDILVYEIDVAAVGSYEYRQHRYPETVPPVRFADFVSILERGQREDVSQGFWTETTMIPGWDGSVVPPPQDLHIPEAVGDAVQWWFDEQIDDAALLSLLGYHATQGNLGAELADASPLDGEGSLSFVYQYSFSSLLKGTIRRFAERMLPQRSLPLLCATSCG